MSDQPYEPTPYERVAQQISAQDSGLGQAGAEEDTVAQQIAQRQADAGQPIGATEVDVASISAAMQAMQARLDALEQERLERNAPALVGAAEQVRDLMAAHASGMTTGTTLDHADGLRLADDAVAAAQSATKSGDTGPFRVVADRLGRWIAKHHPGPGDHPYYFQAVDRAGELGDVADTVNPPLKPAVPVLSGSVVG